MPKPSFSRRPRELEPAGSPVAQHAHHHRVRTELWGVTTSLTCDSAGEGTRRDSSCCTRDDGLLDDFHCPVCAEDHRVIRPERDLKYAKLADRCSVVSDGARELVIHGE